MTALAERLAALLPNLTERHHVPGAQVAVLSEGEISTAAAGVTNTRTGVSVTTDTVFQIGSVTKPLTATLVLQLVDDGQVDLDAPIAFYLPEFRLADPEGRAITVRQLLAHTSGIDGDLFADTGRGDDALARYVQQMAELQLLHPPGAVFSYCNAGYNVLGQLVATISSCSWEEALEQRLLRPAGLSSAGTLPEHALRHRAAIGHLLDDAGTAQPAPEWGMSRSAGPAGLVHATAADTVRFARIHLTGGRADNGTRVLSPQATTAMQTPHVAVPDPWSLGSHWGLGWALQTWAGQPVIGHDGTTIGQQTFLRAFPDQGTAVCVAMNGGNTYRLFHELLDELAGDLGVRRPPGPEPTGGPVLTPTGRRWTGTYARRGKRYQVALEEGRLVLHDRSDGTGAETALPLTWYRDDVYLADLPDVGWLPVVFLSCGGSDYIHVAGRTTPRGSL